MRKPWKPDRPSAKTETAAVSEDAIELAFWDAVKDSSEPRLYQEYLDKYPDGRFASLATAKIEILEKKNPGQAGAPATGKPAPVENDADTPDKPEPPDPRNPGKQLQYKLSKLPEGVKAIADEMAYWDSVKDSSDPKALEDYLQKFPNGMLAGVARLKIKAMEKAGSAGTAPPSSQDPNSPNYRKKLPPSREAIPIASYKGPASGEIQWTGNILNNSGLAIQAGQVNTGSIQGDLPRVPVKVELAGGKATLVTAPSEKNSWDLLSVRNVSGGPLKTLTIRWKVVQ